MKNKNYYVAIGAIVVLLVGTLVIAGKSGPESSLYSLRIGIVEPLFGAAKSGDLAKANYALSLADTRLQELQILKDKNLLTNKPANIARDNFNQQTIVVQNSILNLTKKEGANAHDVLQLSEDLDVDIEKAKAIFNIDQLEILPEGAPIPKATTTKSKI